MSAAREPEVVHGQGESQYEAPQSSGLTAASGNSPLGHLLEEGLSERDAPDRRSLAMFLAEPDWHRKLAIWMGQENLRKWEFANTKVRQQLERDIAQIDRMISRQLSAILHHPAFQKLEASWRGLEHLVKCRERAADDKIQVRVWNVTWKMLRDDLEGAIEFDQSHFFRKIYEEGIGTAGATPFSAILLDFEIHPRPSRQHPFDDIALLRAMSETAAAAFAPLFINAHASMFNIDGFTELRQSLDIEAIHQGVDFLRWQKFRETEESRFVTLLLPRMLMRKPYRPEMNFHFGFAYEEHPQGTEEYLWGNAIWGMGEVLIRNFNESRWFATIRGVERGVVSAGVVVGPARDTFETEPQHAASKPITEMVVTDQFERQLAKLGFATLCATKYGSEAAFYSIPSAQKPKRYSDPEASANAEISAMTNYILCASRFGHYVKLIARDKIGSSLEAYDIQRELSDWFIRYVNRDPDAGPTNRAERPLLDAEVQVKTKPGRPGEYDCIIQMEPFHGFDDIRATVRLDTRIVQPNR
jgi:type VI secretion system protein ImpD